MGDQARATNHIMSIPPKQTAPPLPLSRAPYTRETISEQLYKVPVPNQVDVTLVVERANRSFKNHSIPRLFLHSSVRVWVWINRINPIVLT
jgi:hypothetical protein